MPIQWRDEMAVDHGVIDHDHQMLIAIINEFCDAAPSTAAVPELRAILEKLHRYTTTHFGREEALQRKAGYTFVDAHHHEHVDLIRQLTDIQDQLTPPAPPLNETVEPAEADAQDAAPVVKRPEPDIGALHATMTAFLHHWLVDHIVKSDLRMKPFAAKMAQHARELAPLAQTVSWS